MIFLRVFIRPEAATTVHGSSNSVPTNFTLGLQEHQTTIGLGFAGDLLPA